MKKPESVVIISKAKAKSVNDRQLESIKKQL